MNDEVKCPWCGGKMIGVLLSLRHHDHPVEACTECGAIGPREDYVSSSMTKAEHSFNNGNESPYHEKQANTLPEEIALGVLHDLQDRRGIKHELEQIDMEVRCDIVQALSDIIKVGLRKFIT